MASCADITLVAKIVEPYYVPYITVAPAVGGIFPM